MRSHVVQCTCLATGCPTAAHTHTHTHIFIVCVCVACLTPLLNLRFELHPSWNNIHNTFPTRTKQDTTYSYSDSDCDGGGQHEAYKNYSVQYYTSVQQINLL